jgi:hypothetical protein
VIVLGLYSCLMKNMLWHSREKIYVSPTHIWRLGFIDLGSREQGRAAPKGTAH